MPIRSRTPRWWALGGNTRHTADELEHRRRSGLTTKRYRYRHGKGYGPYSMIRLNGTTSGTFTTILMEAASVIAVVNAQAWSGSATLSVVGGSQTNFHHRAHDQRSRCRCSVLQQISNNRCRYRHGDPFTNSGTTANASTAFVRPLIGVNYSSGVAIDVTLRIAYPALEQAAAATTPATIGPVQMTDALGRKFWRFTGSSALSSPTP